MGKWCLLCTTSFILHPFIWCLFSMVMGFRLLPSSMSTVTLSLCPQHHVILYVDLNNTDLSWQMHSYSNNSSLLHGDEARYLMKRDFKMHKELKFPNCLSTKLFILKLSFKSIWILFTFFSVAWCPCKVKIDCECVKQQRRVFSTTPLDPQVFKKRLQNCENRDTLSGTMGVSTESAEVTPCSTVNSQSMISSSTWKNGCYFV